MKILTGLFEQMVIRRNADGVSEQPFTGECSSGGGQVKISVCGADGGKIEGMLMNSLVSAFMYCEVITFIKAFIS